MEPTERKEEEYKRSMLNAFGLQSEDELDKILQEKREKREKEATRFENPKEDGDWTPSVPEMVKKSTHK